MILVIEFASDPLVTVQELDGLDAGLRRLQKEFPFIKCWNLEFQDLKTAAEFVEWVSKK